MTVTAPHTETSKTRRASVSSAKSTASHSSSQSSHSSVSSYLPSLKIPKTMIKLWPTSALASPMDPQLTPRAGPNGQERLNPFEVPSPSSPTPGVQTPTLSQSSSYHHHLLSTHSLTASVPRSVTADLTPQFQGQPLTPTSPGGNLALPTTQLTLHAPDFNMRQPPPSKQRKPANDKSSTPSSSSASSSSTSNSNGAAPVSGPSKGQIHVKLIQARGLNVRSVNARPYVVVQFEQNEFVSRDPTDETDKEVKGTATNLSRNSSSNALNALNAIGSRAPTDAKRGKNSNGSSPSSSLPGKSGLPALPNNLFGRLPAHNPVWKHEVSL